MGWLEYVCGNDDEGNDAAADDDNDGLSNAL